MKITVKYIPLNKIRSDGPVPLTERIKTLKSYLWDCMHVLAVRRNKKDGSFTILSGYDRYIYLRDHTKKQYAPCIVDENQALSEIESYLARFIKSKGTGLEQPKRLKIPLLPSSWLIIRAFLKLEPRFSLLTRRQQIKVILLAVQSKRTVVNAMRSKVDELLSYNKQASS